MMLRKMSRVSTFSAGRRATEGLRSRSGLQPGLWQLQNGNPTPRTDNQRCGSRRTMMSSKDSKVPKAGKRSERGINAQIETLAKLLDIKPKKMPELSEEERQRNFEIGKRYNRMMAKEHNTRMADLTMKINLRDDAIANLPEILQHAARQRDLTSPPLNRRMATHTPPIPGYNPMDYVTDDDETPKSGANSGSKVP